MQSFSEIDTTSKRASKAAGFAWGIAEEIGKNMRNLEMFGLPGIKNLNLYLQKIKKTPTEKLKKIEKKNKPKFKEFCPIYCGTAFLDNCKKLETLKLIKFFNVSYPLLFLPFLSRASDIVGKKISVKYEKNNFLLNFEKTIFSNNINNDKVVSKAKEISIEFLENSIHFLLKNGKSFTNFQKKLLLKKQTVRKKKVRAQV